MTQIITTNWWWGGGVWVYKYKWSVNTYEDLPSTWLKVWDVYNVVNAHTTAPEFPAWANVAWTWTYWDVLGWTYDMSDINTKTFNLSSDTDLTWAQSVLDWYKEWNNPIVNFTWTWTAQHPNWNYLFNWVYGSYWIQFVHDKMNISVDTNWYSYSRIDHPILIIDGNSSWEATGIYFSSWAWDAGFLETDRNYATPYTPVYDWSPTTKKYVDDCLSNYTLSCDLATVATSWEYCDLSWTPTIWNWKLTVCVNWLCKNEFTANQTANVWIDIWVPTCTSQLSNDSWYIDNTVSDLCNYTLSSNLCAVATSGKYCDLSGRVTDNCQIANSCWFITSSALSTYAKCCDIPTDNCQLSNWCGYTTCTGTLVASDIANLAQCCDIPTDNCQLLNGCWYTTCTGTVIASDLTPYAKSCDLCTVATTWKYCDLTGTPALCTVATSGKYCDLTWLPTIPTDNCQLANGCWYTTCTGTVVVSDLNPYAKSCDLCAVATSGCYCDLTWTPTIPTDNCQLSNGCGYAKASTLCTVATSWKYCDLTWTPTIWSWTLTIQKNWTCVDTFSANATANKTINITVPTDNCQLANSCGYTTCTWTVVASDLTPYTKSCDLCTVATTGKYCDLTWRPTIPTVIDNLCSSCTTEALSAKQGCVLNARLDTVEARGRFLSNWNATTWQPVSFPEATPYTYSTWDYYDVTVVWATNYKPSWSSYTWAASTTVETWDLEIWDTYVYDGTNWLLQQNHNITTSFSSISWSPYDNTCLASALWDKANTSSLCAIATSGKYCDLTGTPTIPTDNCQLSNWCGYITSSALSWYQLTCNMVCNLSWADNSHYPTAKAVADALSCAWQWDMLKSVYDPNNKNADAFDYDNFINTPTLCTVATSGKYCDLTGTPSLCTVATSGKYCDLTWTPTIPAAQIQSDWTQTCNTCKDYIKNKPSLCTVATSGKYCDLTWTPSLCAVATSWKYCDLSWTPTIPTNNNQLANWCWYTTCTWTVVASDLTPYALSSSLCTVATSGKYCDLTGTPTIPAAQIQSDWTQSCSACKDYIKNKPSLCTVATSGKYCDLSGTPTIPTNNNQLTNWCWYTTCTWTLVASDLTPYAKTCDLKAVATSWKYCDLTWTPTIWTATLTIQKNWTTVNTFWANATSNVTANITVPTNTCELTNWAWFITAANLVSWTWICVSGCTICNTWVLQVNWSTGCVNVCAVPSGWTCWQVLTKTSTWCAWCNATWGHSTTTVSLCSACWSSCEQTVSATWVTASNTVIVSPAPANIQDYADWGVYASAQWSGTLTFTAETEPTSDITVNVLIMS